MVVDDFDMDLHSAVIPGRVEDANPESRDSPMCNCTSEVWSSGPSRNDAKYTPANSKLKLHIADVVLDGIGLHFETEVPAHFQHDRVFRQNVPRDRFETFGFRVFDDQLHQRPAQPPALEIGSEQDRVFAS